MHRFVYQCLDYILCPFYVTFNTKACAVILSYLSEKNTVFPPPQIFVNRWRIILHLLSKKVSEDYQVLWKGCCLMNLNIFESPKRTSLFSFLTSQLLHPCFSYPYSYIFPYASLPNTIYLLLFLSPSPFHFFLQYQLEGGKAVHVNVQKT